MAAASSGRDATSADRGVVLAAAPSLIADGLERALADSGEFHMVRVTSALSEVLEAGEGALDLLVCSGDLDGHDELDVVRGLDAAGLKVPVVVVSERDDAGSVTAAARAGARGYLLATTTAAALLSCCDSVAQGGTFFDPRVAGHLVDAARGPSAAAAQGPDALTGRELEILSLVARGGSTRSIAAELVLSVHSVRSHVEHIFAKLGVSSRAAAVSTAMAAGADLSLDPD